VTLGPALPAPFDAATRAVLHHPDRHSDWLIVVAATLPGQPDPVRLADQVPLTTARRGRGAWVAGAPNAIVTVHGDPLTTPELWAPLRLADEAPVRVVVSGRRVALAGHHAAFDGRSLLALLSVIAGGEPPRPPNTRRRDATAAVSSGRGPLARLAGPADPVAPTPAKAPGESRAWRAVTVTGGAFTARLAAAVVNVIAAHNRGAGRRWRRVGISLGLAGPPGLGNLASYRRIDLDLARVDDVAAAVDAVLSDPGGLPAELRRAPRILRLLGPAVRRLGDSVLVSNLGPVDDHDLTDAVFFPVARGRSAVSFGLVGSVLSIRARDLDQADAEALLDATVAALR
jgi:hypothetical protein